MEKPWEAFWKTLDLTSKCSCRNSFSKSCYLTEVGNHRHRFDWEAQGATGRMKDKFRGGYKQLWKCKDGKYRNYHNTEYAKQPWEVEAYKMQGPLTKAFMEEYGVK